MHSNKGFSLIELMIVVAIIGILSMLVLPVYDGYIARTKIANIANVLANIGGEINASYMSGAPESNNFSTDYLLKLAPNVNKIIKSPRCTPGGYRGYELIWTDRTSISRILSIDSTYIKQFGLMTYKHDPACTSSSITWNNTRLSMFVALDETKFGLPVNNNIGMNGFDYTNNIMVVTNDVENTYYADMNGVIDRVTNNSPTCGMFVLRLENVKQHITIPRGYLPQVCRYASIYDSTNNKRKLYPI